MADQPTEDLVVIGAGWYGLVAAKTFLDVNPAANITVLEAAPCLGGVWSKDRICHGLRSNNMAGTYEYSDFPMNESEFGVKRGQHIPGEVVNKYLDAYSHNFGITKRIRFNSRVDTISKEPEGHWRITSTSCTTKSCFDIRADKLIVATGLATETIMPDIPGESSFSAPLLHCKDLARYPDLYSRTKSIAIVGGSKSAWDAAYAFASHGAKVHWIIRDSGHGPSCMAPPLVTPLKLWLEKSACTRFIGWMSPCAWGGKDGFGWVRSFWERTTVGQLLGRQLWAIFENYIIRLNTFDQSPDFQQLKPWDSGTTRFGGGFSVFNYPTDFFEYVRNGQISVNITNIDHLSPGTLHLQAGEFLPVDALICSSGWRHRPGIRFLPEGMESKMGLPDSGTGSNRRMAADRKILDQFPCLKGESDGEGDPWRLYRFMVPPALIDDRSIGFMGFISTLMHPLCAQTQALWLTAYFGGKLRFPSEDRIWDETMLHSQFPQWRYPGGFGDRFPVFFFDGVPYIDLLLNDLGLRVRRKRSIMAEIFQAYGPSDYRNLVGEWKRVAAEKKKVPAVWYWNMLDITTPLLQPRLKEE